MKSHKHIAKALSKERLKAGATQTELADVCGRTSQQICNVERGACGLPPEMAIAIARYLTKHSDDFKKVYDKFSKADAKDHRDHYDLKAWSK